MVSQNYKTMKKVNRTFPSKKCLLCKKEFTPNQGRQKYCGSQASKTGCSNAMNRTNRARLQRLNWRKYNYGANLEELGKQSCRRCGATKDLSLNHKIPASIRRKKDMTNYEILCRPCNAKEYQDLVKEAMKYYFKHKYGI